jgi:hypothetical protein
MKLKVIETLGNPRSIISTLFRGATPTEIAATEQLKI